MADEPSNGELGRLIQALRGDFREDLAQLSSRLDRVVNLDVYAVEKAATNREIESMRGEIAAIKAQRQQDANRVTQTRRYVLASVIIPLLGVVVPLLVLLKGGGS